MNKSLQEKKNGQRTERFLAIFSLFSSPRSQVIVSTHKQDRRPVAKMNEMKKMEKTKNKGQGEGM